MRCQCNAKFFLRLPRMAKRHGLAGAVQATVARLVWIKYRGPIFAWQCRNCLSAYNLR